MSRCFPFPPPGYDKKIQLNDLDLLKKERHKEKKHKKEKRDKEKKEGKEKREKHRSDEKHREKKDKKAKHGDIKEDKEKRRDKDKDGNTLSYEKKGAGQMDAYKDRVEKSSEKSKDRENDNGATLDAKKVVAQPRIPNGAIPNQNSLRASELKSSKHVHEEDKKKANDKRTSILLPGKSGNSDQQRTEDMVRLGSSSTATMLAGTDRSKERKSVDGKVERQVAPMDSRPSGTSLQNSSGMAHHKHEAVALKKEKGTDWKMEVKNKIRENEVDLKGGKVKEKERSTTKYRNKTEEKVKEMVAVKPMGLSRVRDTEKIHAELLRLNDGSKELLATQSPKLENFDNNGNKMALTHETSKKRKEIGLNGVLYEEDVGPKKMARSTPLHPMGNNGRNLELYQSPIVSMPSHPTQVTSKDHRLNGTIESQTCPKPPQPAVLHDQNSVPLKNKLKPSRASVLADQNSVSLEIKPKPSQAATADHKSAPLKNKPKSSLTAVPADQNFLSSKNKPPHPDSKYLSQVLSVPNLDLLSDAEDMGWLFHSSKKPRVEGSGNPTTQVWADAVRIESADIYALPYVIPR